MSDVALANEPEARTETGEIKDQTPATETTTQPTTSPEKPSLVNEKPPEAPEGAPKAYETFKAPDSFEMAEETVKEVGELFKSLDLSQSEGQKLIDYYVKKNQEAATAPYKLWQDTQEKWINEVKADSEMGSKLTEVRSTISKAIDGLGDPKLASAFREAMDYTGAGNNPAFIRALWKLSQKVTEGGHVPGQGPSPFGQTAPGQSEKPTAAKALYPNLP